MLKTFLKLKLVSNEISDKKICKFENIHTFYEHITHVVQINLNRIKLNNIIIHVFSALFYIDTIYTHLLPICKN